MLVWPSQVEVGGCENLFTYIFRFVRRLDHYCSSRVLRVRGHYGCGCRTAGTLQILSPNVGEKTWACMPLLMPDQHVGQHHVQVETHRAHINANRCLRSWTC